MKKLLFALSMTFYCLSYAQKANDNDTKVMLTNPESHENITMMLNTGWFEPNKNVKYSYVSKDKSIVLRIMGVTYMDFEKAFENLEKKGGAILEEGHLMRLINSKGSSKATTRIYYGIASGDGRIISLEVIVPLAELEEWQPYFDNVARSLTIQNNQ